MRSAALTFPLGAARKLFWIDRFLAADQCARALEELEFARWRHSGVTTYRPWRGLRSTLSPMRVSETAMESWFTPELCRLVRGIDRRIAALVPRFAERREEWQATRYGRGGKFEYHFDCGSFGHEAAGEREQTVLLYLNTPRRGGATHFRELNVEVNAVGGRLVVWRNLTADNERDLDMLHAGTPLIAGRKTVLVTWVRQHELRNRRTS